MNLKLRHIIVLATSFFLVACAMGTDNASESPEMTDFKTKEEDHEISLTMEVGSNINAELINQKLQDFYDLVALQNEHPEFNEEVIKQLKGFTNDSINNFNVEDFILIKNIKRLGEVIIVNDSIQKIKLTYDIVSTNTKQTDTIYAIVTKKKIKLDNETLLSNKIQFSKN